MNRWMRGLGRWAGTPADPPHILLQKATLMLVSLLTVLAGLAWAAMYLALGQPWAALVPALYSGLVGLGLGLAWLVRCGHYQIFLGMQLSLILVLPVTMQAVLGGLAASGGVMLWGFLCPLGAALFQDHRRTRYWFGAYLGCVVLLIVLDPMLRVHALPLSATLSAAVLAMNILGLTVVAFLGLQFFVQQLDREYSRSESLLDNVLPRSIAARLKGGESTIADGFDSVSILFADLVGFTRASTLMKPEIMVAYLNDVFSVFDRLVEKRGLEKIKTIGDAYMVVGGLGQGPQDVVPVIADLAMDMHRAMKTMQGPVDLQLRIGIHTGAAVAGVIGVKRFAYDVRGDTVNTASRMESHGLPGETQISEQTRAALGEHFEVQERGPVEIKGKGSMCTYWLRGRRRRSLLDLARRSVLSETGPQDTGSRPN